MIKYFKQITTAAALSVAFAGTAAQAAFVTIDEVGVNEIFSQESFGDTPIEIIFNEVVELVAPDLLDITTDAEVNALFSMHIDPANEASFFFVDTIDACGGFDVNIVGCGETPGNDFMVESDFADSRFNAELLAHELAHNLGLDHTVGGLMDPIINGERDLTEAQVALIFQNLGNSLVQFDQDGDAFVVVNPVLVVAGVAQVPLPAAGLLLMGALAGLSAARRKRRVAA